MERDIQNSEENGKGCRPWCNLWDYGLKKFTIKKYGCLLLWIVQRPLTQFPSLRCLELCLSDSLPHLLCLTNLQSRLLAGRELNVQLQVFLCPSQNLCYGPVFPLQTLRTRGGTTYNQWTHLNWLEVAAWLKRPEKFKDFVCSTKYFGISHEEILMQYCT